MNIKVLNELKPNVLPYLPHGITTLEMKMDTNGEDVNGFIHPLKLADRKKKMYVGYADESQDFLILWGGGYVEGLPVTKENSEERRFMQVLHVGKTLDRQSISLCYNDIKIPISNIKLVPAEDAPNLVSYELMKNKATHSATISFKGTRMPSYYSRWFPPRTSKNKMLQYHDIEAPNILIKFKFKEARLIPDINSHIDIFLDGIKIAQVTGDWQYSWPHAEFFTIFGDNRYFVLRLWLYWIKAEFSNSFFKDMNNRHGRTRTIGKKNKRYLGGDMSKNIVETRDIECPDIERFDFLIDMKKRKVTWMGTDFHYQEFWYKIDDAEPLLKAGIALPWETIEQVFLRLQYRFNQPKKNYDPMTLLKKFLENPDMKRTLLGKLTATNLGEGSNIANKGRGWTRKHIPYNENGNVVKELISSVVTS